MYPYYEASQFYNKKTFYVRKVIGPECGQLVHYCNSLQDAEKWADIYNKSYNLKKGE